jgi:hypothetical protein
MISFRNVGRSFAVAGGKSYVLRRIALDIAAGDFVMSVVRAIIHKPTPNSTPPTASA